MGRYEIHVPRQNPTFKSMNREDILFYNTLPAAGMNTFRRFWEMIFGQKRRARPSKYVPVNIPDFLRACWDRPVTGTDRPVHYYCTLERIFVLRSDSIFR